MSDSRRGRPRDDSARAAALTAAKGLLLSDGYENLSLDQVAARAGVGKQSIYRWWGSKSELIAQAVLEGFASSTPIPIANTGDTRADVHSIVDALVRAMRDEANVPLVRALVVVAATDADASTLLWERFTGPTRTAIAARLTEAVSQGEVSDVLSGTAAAEALIGAGLFLLLARQPIPENYANALTDLILGPAN